MAEGGAKRSVLPQAIPLPPLSRMVDPTVTTPETEKRVVKAFVPALQNKPEPITWRMIGASVITVKLVIFCGILDGLLKTRYNCLNVALDHLEAGKSVAVYNSNVDSETKSPLD
ncbi:hypothetical protein N7537_010589 [Penicillium hordei]|uniref:Uncharacterized protein n=1 Tax=Penicillium hordei TaxID=40994 RepID=A0AAD6GY77_9EURO|nr:uncharacterized protein N7537_010589 [Penicillium hordei]KAJ5593685.1 hypothetical protein N7537_010589 [Penicillium hordei]